MKPLKIFLIILLIIFGCKSENVPKVATLYIGSITQTSATYLGSIISQGDCDMTYKGFYYGNSYDLTSMDSIRVKGSSIGNYVCNLTNLNPGSKYFVRAFATNCYGTGYGDTISFTTGAATAPIVITSNITNITCTTATSGGKITSDGGLQINDRGLCWGTSENPTKNDNFISLENEYKINPFSYTIRNLGTNSDYYVRAYATNPVGTGYGESIQFCTKTPDPNYDPHSIIGTWDMYCSIGDPGGLECRILGTTYITEFTKDSIQIDRYLGNIISDHKITISGNTITILNESGDPITRTTFQLNNSGDTLSCLYQKNGFRSYSSRLY